MPKPKSRVGWVCDACGKEVIEMIVSITSAGGGSLAEAYFKHVKKSSCHYQRATTERLPR